ncbi:hypothetical protein PMIN06_008712 [Paraphaeosphaeria minitans]
MRPILLTLLLASGISAIPTVAQDPGLNITFHGNHERSCDRRCAATVEGLAESCAPGVPGKNGGCWSCCWYRIVEPTPSPTPEVEKNPNGGGYGRMG